jgi:hypothetical protein
MVNHELVDESRREERTTWPLSEQPVVLESVPGPIARAFEALGVLTWADVEALGSPAALLFLYPGVGRRSMYWVKHELARRRGAVRWSNSGRVEIPRFTRLKCDDLPADRKGVYFIQCGPFVKIGQAVSVRRRFQGLQQVIPFQLELLGVVELQEGQSLLSLEREYHRRFKSAHQINEWFRLEGELDIFCLELARGERVA